MMCEDGICMMGKKTLVASTALLSKERDGFFKIARKNKRDAEKHTVKCVPCSLIHFRRQTQIKLDLPLCLGAFPPTCALRKQNPKNSSRNLVEQKPDNAIPVALRGLSARKQEVNTSRTVNVFLMHVCIFMYACVWKSHNPVDTTDFFKIKRNT